MSPNRSPRISRFKVTLLALACIPWSTAGAAGAAISGQYLQVGSSSRLSPSGELVAADGNGFQVAFKTQRACEDAAAHVIKSLLSATSAEDVLKNVPAVWCSPSSRSAALPFHGVFKSKITGNSARIETADMALCRTAFEMMTGGQADNNHTEITTDCQVK